MTIRKLPGSQIESNTITITQIQTTAVTTIVNQSGPRVASLIYPGDDTAGNTVGGQTVYINGSGFETNNAIYINGNAVPSKSFISASNLSFTTPSLAAGIYPVYLINTDSGATAIFVPGYISSAEPTWVTGSSLSEVGASDAWSISLSATGDAPITYALANGSSLPSGISLAANGLISGTLSSPPANDTQYTFTVVASDAQNQDASRQFIVTVSTGEGVLFANNVLLIHADGTNNQNNHTFLDSSNNNFTITRNGNATQGSFSPFSQTGWSGYFDGTGDYLTVANNSSLAVESGNFTIEGWIYTISGSSTAFFIMDTRNADDDTTGFVVYRRSTGKLTFGYYDGSFIAREGNTTIQANRWYHIAITRQSSDLKIFVNGVLDNSTTTVNRNFSRSANVRIAASWSDTNACFGYISNLRLLKGTALYTAGFTPPSEPLAPIANTSLLTLQSNRFIDDGPNNLTITRNGDTSIQPFSPFVSGLLTSNSHSVFFDGTGDYLSLGTTSSFNFLHNSAALFTIEGWIYSPSFSTERIIFDTNAGSSNGIGASFWISTSGNLRLLIGKGIGGSAVIDATSTGTVPTNSWVHVAVVYDQSLGSNNCIFYINGVASGTANKTVNAPSSSNSSNSGRINAYGDSAGGACHLSNIRVNNSLVYNGAFTPSTSSLAAIANTAVLACQSATLIDNSTNAFTITRNGDAAPRKFNPFGQTFNSNVAYSTANVGGSAYFDGTGDWLLTASSPATLSGDFTIEGWVYITSFANNRSLVCIGDNFNSSTGAFFYINTSGRLEIFGNNGSILVGTSQTVLINTWNHIAFVRSSGTIRAYLNGTADTTTATNSTAFTGINRIGGELYNGNDGGAVMLGYISNYRLINGTAVYTSNFVPPSAPLTNIANTSLLCNFTNAGIFDQTAKNILETIGDAKISTAQYKYGIGSIVFDGTGDYIKSASSNLNILGGGDFTIEFWLYPNNTTSAYRALVSSENYPVTTGGWSLYQNGTAIEFWLTPGSSVTINATSAITASTWQHLALCRASGTLRLFINGTSVASVSNSTSLTGQQIWIGDNNGGDYFFNGYIDDLRITKGYARYTSNFTAPTAALKDK